MTVNVVAFSFSWCSTGGPEVTLLGDGFLYGILSASSPDLNSSGPKAPSAWCGFPYHISSITPSDLQLYCNCQLSWLPSWLRYIIVQRLLDRPLDLWNRMFNRHQAEITVMQFTCHSLSVYQSMSVPWEFFSSSHFNSQFPLTRFPLITVIRMCPLLPVHPLEMTFLAGSKAKIKGQNTTVFYSPSLVGKVAFAIVIIINKTIMVIIVFDITDGCL